MRFQAIKIWSVVVLFLALIPILGIADPTQAPNKVVLRDLGWDYTYEQHQDRISQIKHGTIVVFQSVTGNKSFRVGKLLGSGYTTYIYELLDYPDKVLRIPSEHTRSWHLRYLKRSFLNATIKGSKKIENAGIPSVKVHDYRYDQYVVVDRVHGFTLEEYLLTFDKFSAEDREKIEKDLVEFGLKTTKYSRIDDFRPDQMMYDKKRGWLLTDWTWNVHQPKNEYETVFQASAEIFQEDNHPSKDKLDFASKLFGDVIRAIHSKRGVVLPSQCRYLFSGNSL